VGREETIGMVAAVEAWVKRDHKAEWSRWMGYLDTIAKRVTQVEGVKTAVREPRGLSNRTPTLQIFWDPAKLHVTGEELAETVARTKPRIALGAGGGLPRKGGPESAPEGMTSLDIAAWMMQPGNDKVVAERLYQLLSEKRQPKPAPAAPVANLSGRWDVSVQFFSSSSQHTLMLEQRGNELFGTHKGEFSVRDVFGTIEGDKIKLQSTERAPGDSLTFTFSGTVSGDSLAGPIHMGEYLTAKFTASRHAYPPRRGTILVPNGPPLAN
jgi:hypothetical protein